MIQESETEIQTSHGQRLRLFITEKGPFPWILVTHGLGEHAGRQRFINKLFGDRYNILRYDLRGHGESQGKKGVVGNFSYFYEDLKAIWDFLLVSYRAKEIILWGHSMGGAIVAGFIQKFSSDLEGILKKVILSAPFMEVGGKLSSLVGLLPTKTLKFFCKSTVGITLQGLVTPWKLTHDPFYQEDYLQDPLVQKALNTKLVFEMMLAGREIFSQKLGVTCPVHIIVGEGDELVSVKKIQEYCTYVDKKCILKTIPEGRHELHHEIDKYRLVYFRYLESLL